MDSMRTRVNSPVRDRALIIVHNNVCIYNMDICTCVFVDVYVYVCKYKCERVGEMASVDVHCENQWCLPGCSLNRSKHTKQLLGYK